jgi:hypothetical protein
MNSESKISRRQAVAWALAVPALGMMAAGLSASARAQSTSERRQVFPATSAAWAGAQSDKPLQLAL